MAKSDYRTRNWELIVYPDSAPDDWIDYLDSLHLPFVVSPLHDKDIKEDGSGEFKKPHYHVYLMFSGKKSEEQIEDLCSNLGDCPFRKVHSLHSAIRYTIHLDNPEKAQYQQSEIQCHGGAVIDKFFELSPNERYIYLSEMRSWITDNICIRFSDLYTYADVCKHDTWFRLLSDNSAFIMKTFIDDFRESLKENPNYYKDYSGMV